MKKNRLIILSATLSILTSLVGCGEQAKTIDDATNAVKESASKLQEVSSSYYDAGFLATKSTTKIWSYETDSSVELTDDNAYVLTSITNIDATKLEKVKAKDLTSVNGAVESYTSLQSSDFSSELHYKNGHAYINLNNESKYNVSTELDTYLATALNADLTFDASLGNLVLDYIQDYCASLDEKAEDDPYAVSISFLGYTFTPYYENTFKVVREMLTTETNYYSLVVSWFNGEKTSKELLDATIDIADKYLPKLLEAMMPASIYKAISTTYQNNISIEGMLLTDDDQNLVLKILDTVQETTKNSIKFSIGDKEISFAMDSEGVEKIYNTFYDALSDNYSSLKSADNDEIHNVTFTSLYGTLLDKLAEQNINEEELSFSSASIKYLLNDGVLSGVKGSVNYFDDTANKNMTFAYETSLELSGTKYIIDKTYDSSYTECTQEEFIELINSITEELLSSSTSGE